MIWHCFKAKLSGRVTTRVICRIHFNILVQIIQTSLEDSLCPHESHPGVTYQNTSFLVKASPSDVNSCSIIARRSGLLMWRCCSGIFSPLRKLIPILSVGRLTFYPSNLKEVDFYTRRWNKLAVSSNPSNGILYIELSMVSILASLAPQ